MSHWNSDTKPYGKANGGKGSCNSDCLAIAMQLSGKIVQKAINEVPETSIRRRTISQFVCQFKDHLKRLNLQTIFPHFAKLFISLRLNCNMTAQMQLIKCILVNETESICKAFSRESYLVPLFFSEN